MAAETLTWVEANGTELVLTDGVWRNDLAGRLGAWMPPVSFVEEAVPLQPGARLRQVKVGVREVDVPLLLRAPSEPALRTSVRALLRSFNPSRGDGKLRVRAADGSERELTCRYAGGFEGDEGPAAKGNLSQRVVLIFRAADPYWYARTGVQTIYTLGSPATFFPFFPLRLSSSTIFADATVANAGDVEAWPVWQLTGPGVDPVLRNLTSGELMSLSLTLAAGESLAIDTRPGRKSVTADAGSNQFGALSAASVLWALQAGDNAVRVEMSGATADSQVSLSYTPRYLGC